MSDARYNIVFDGSLVPGADPAAVRANLGRLFRMTPERVEALFSGKRMVLKRDADQATAMKFRAALKQAGAQCQMVESSPAAVAAPSPAAPEQRSSPADSNREMVGTIRTGGEGFSGPFEVAPPGADLDTTERQTVSVNPDISHLSMAPPGTELEELAPRKAAVNPDISHLSLADDS
ncbi:hypothetical protein K8B33_01645 [Alcanivorax sp. JB21]|uniref:hypothetical protein n=1 Tax=Alcanivorax limicola TaxID=2874102 RepID=UPI001CBABC5D|nr:hypothetical protein [Alcanivorax limicola]MBZ2187790.1 hypothetical protein [Alcanivorax limicola]